MNHVIGICIGVLIGCAATYLILGKSFSTASQLAYEAQLSNDVRAIQVLEEDGGDALRELLITGLSCSAKIYNDHLQTIFWDRTAFSDKLLKKLEAYKEIAPCERNESSTLSSGT